MDCKNEFNNKPNVVAVVGPTASGKTGLSIELAKSFNGEVISADSIQIYKELNIGVAKPTKEEMQGVPHHMLGFLDVFKEYSVAEYVKEAHKLIKDIEERGKTPILCGGTGLYVDSILNNIEFSKENSNVNIREQLIEKANKYGAQALIDQLNSFDPVSAQSIHPNNIKRIIRAIEIYQTTGVTMTQHIKDSKTNPSLYNSCIIGLKFKNRDILYNRINNRVDIMMEQGLLDEARYILSLGCSKTAMSAIAYKELSPFLNGECSLEHAVDKLKTATRRYAKRQLTWFNKNESINWIYVDEYNDMEEILDVAKLILKKNFVNGVFAYN